MILRCPVVYILKFDTIKLFSIGFLLITATTQLFNNVYNKCVEKFGCAKITKKTSSLKLKIKFVFNKFKDYKNIAWCIPQDNLC